MSEAEVQPKGYCRQCANASSCLILAENGPECMFGECKGIGKSMTSGKNRFGCFTSKCKAKSIEKKLNQES